MSEATTDRELLELAAKAMGRRTAVWKESSHKLWLLGRTDDERHLLFDPRDDDGDSRRLEVELHLTVSNHRHECEVFNEEGECLASVPIFTASAFVTSAEATCPRTAARLAVLCAAAEIGRAIN